MANFNKRVTFAAIALALFGGLISINAEAKIIATRLATPLTTTSYNQSKTYTWESYSLDVNRDGLVDLEFWYDSVLASPYDGHTNAYAAVAPHFGSGVAANVVPMDPRFKTDVAINFAQGSMIDSSAYYGPLADNEFNKPFAVNEFDPSNNYRDAYGHWANGGRGSRGFMGFIFTDINGGLHYAWMDIGIKAFAEGDISSYRISIYGYAYETVANKGILAGDTGVVAPPSVFSWSIIPASSVGGATTGAPKTDVYAVTCGDGTAKLSASVKDLPPSKAALVSIQVIKGFLSSPLSTDAGDGDAAYSPTVTLAAEAGIYNVQINKQHSAAIGPELYTAKFACLNTTGAKTDTSAAVIKQNQ